MKVFVVSGAYLNTGVFTLWIGLQQDFPWGRAHACFSVGMRKESGVFYAL